MCTCTEVIHGAVGLAKAATGIDRAEAATIEARRVICRACEHALPCVFRGLHTLGRKCKCAKCGCNLRAKTTLAGENCPDGRW